MDIIKKLSLVTTTVVALITTSMLPCHGHHGHHGHHRHGPAIAPAAFAWHIAAAHHKPFALPAPCAPHCAPAPHAHPHHGHHGPHGHGCLPHHPALAPAPAVLACHIAAAHHKFTSKPTPVACHVAPAHHMATAHHAAAPHAFTSKQIKEFMDIHNNHRKAFGLKPLQWDDGLAKSANVWADHLAKTKKMYHSHKPGVGENIFWGSSSAGPSHTMAHAANAWATEKKFMKGKKFDPTSKAGHYTPMIWSSTQKVGAALVTNGNETYVVAHYWPQGNIIGHNVY